MGALLACVLLVVLCAVFPVFVNTAIGYVPVVAALVLLALCFVYLQLVRRCLSFSEVGPNSACTRGDVLPFALSVENTGMLPALHIEATFAITDVFGGDGKTETRLLALPGRSKNTFDLGVRFDHVGTCQVGIQGVRVFCPLSLFRTTRQGEALHTVAIEPKLVDIAAFEVSDKALRESTKNIKTFINEGLDFSGVRDYRWGDPMKSIHWKLSSKSQDSYFTRLYETPTTPGMALFLDFECSWRGTEALACANDVVLECALSIERYATEAGYETEVLFVGEGGVHTRVVGPVSSRMADFLARVPRMGYGSGAGCRHLLAREAALPTCQNNLIVCTANVTEELCNQLCALAGPERRPFLVAVLPPVGLAEPDKQARTALRRLVAARVPFAAVRSACDLVGGGVA